MTIAWVLGSSGLLGAALCRRLRADGTTLFSPARRFSWEDEGQLHLQIATAVRAFAQAAQGLQRWELHWAAGVGTMGSPQQALWRETHALTELLAQLQAQPQLMATPGLISFASSAGAIYAGSQDEIITELCSTAPTTPYAFEKLKQEELLRDFAARSPCAQALLARISTLYGPGQARGKKQGLLGTMAHNILRQRPIQIYVPFDTIRDYIDADDAARTMIGTLRAAEAGTPVQMRIIASEQAATIAEIVALFRRLARRTPLVVRSANRLSSLYTRRVQFRSVLPCSYQRSPGKRLPVGIAELLKAEHLAFTQSSPSALLPNSPGRPACGPTPPHQDDAT